MLSRPHFIAKTAIHAIVLLGFLSSALLPAFSKDRDAGRRMTETVEGATAEKLDLYLTRIAPYGFSGALLVAQEGKIILNKGYGLAVRSSRTRNTALTVFSTGSITKQFTAAGIMKLEMMGKLNTNDPVSAYLDGVPEDKKDITLHQLLTHTAGVIEYTGPDYEKAQRDATVRKILEARLLFEPGSRFQYSNVGFSLLAAIIEKVSGQPYEKFLHQHLFEPSGMQYTGYRLADWSKKIVAHWYNGSEDNGTPLEKPYPFWNLLGNGGILSTTEDMYKWHVALLGERVLSKSAKKKMFTPNLNEYGYGWDVIDSEHGLLIQHDGGSMLGSSAEMRRYIDAGIVTILFCNQSYEGRALFDAVRDKIETLVFGGSVEIPPPVLLLAPEKAQRFKGLYRLPSRGMLRVKAEQGRLLIEPEGQDAVIMLIAQGESSAKRFEQYNQLSSSVFEAALKGDYGPMGHVLANKDKRMERVKELIQMRLERYSERTGKLQKVHALFTLPARFNGQEAAETFVELEGSKGAIYFRLYWKDGKNVGIGPAMRPPKLSTPFLLTSGSEFVGYRLDMARNLSVKFILDTKNDEYILSVSTRTGTLKARKM